MNSIEREIEKNKQVAEILKIVKELKDTITSGNSEKESTKKGKNEKK